MEVSQSSSLAKPIPLPWLIRTKNLVTRWAATQLDSKITLSISSYVVADTAYVKVDFTSMASRHPWSLRFKVPARDSSILQAFTVELWSGQDWQQVDSLPLPESPVAICEYWLAALEAKARPTLWTRLGSGLVPA